MFKLKRSLEDKYKKLRLFYFKKISKKFLFEVQLADHCNLNCIGCSHFSSVADEHFLDVENYKKDCERFAQLANKNVYMIHLLGGEPLLHKDIAEIMDITRKNFNNCIIKVVTNGITLDRMEPGFWESCKRNNVIISITVYPININVSKICQLSMQYGVKIERFGTDFTMEFRKDVLDPEGKQDIKDSFKKCGPLCHQLYEGKLYMCRVPAYIKYVNKTFSKNLEVKTEDYIDIYKVKNSGALLKYLRKPIPFCRYCNKNATSSTIWRISKKEESEWF